MIESLKLRFNQHPNVLWVIVFGKLWDTFSYFGTQTILALYFMNIFHLSRGNSFLLYGGYAAVAFSMPMLGGIISDRWLGNKNSIILGASLNLLGNLMLIFLDRHLFCIGLALSLIGSGFYKSSATSLIGKIYKGKEGCKEGGYTILYVAMNIGGALGPIIYGATAYYFSWNYVFLFSAFTILLGLLIFLLNRKQVIFLGDHNFLSKKTLKAILCLLPITALLSVVFYYPVWLNVIVSIMFFSFLVYLFIMIHKAKKTSKPKLFAIVLLCFIAMFYFAIGLQTGTTITFFIQEQISNGKIEVNFPGSTFNTLYCLFVVLLVPVFSTLWAILRKKRIDLLSPAKVSIGILLAAFGVLMFAVATKVNHPLTMVIIGYLFLSAGELVLVPSAYTAISNHAPNNMKSTMMGCWLLFIAMGGWFSGELSNNAHYISGEIFDRANEYYGVFLSISLFALLVGFISIIVGRKISYLFEN